jgi:glucans biosynthesis protein
MADLIRRRDALTLAAGAGAALFLPWRAVAGEVSGPDPRVVAQLRKQAQALAKKPYQPPSTDLPKALAEIDYDAYRDLRFKPAKSLWRDLNLPFEVQMFHRGGLFREPVEMFEAVGGKITPIAYDPSAFDFGPRKLGDLPPDLGFAGFRLHGAINKADYLDEICAFLGASYFRAVGKGDAYGLSARGLAIGAGEAGEEFPRFTEFVLERPEPGQAFVVVHALLDSPSLAGAYSFRITPGQPTRFDVTLSLFPRVALSRVGIAPLTSMYLFANEQPRRFDDFRPEVHDSDGLSVTQGGGERLWRPLINPKAVQSTTLPGGRVAGFGLMQRQRGIAAYQDFEANYHQRPSAWVSPVSGFDDGEVRLVELPAKTEFEDNIFAAWRPSQPLTAGREYRFAYRIDWGDEPAGTLPRALAWREGRGEGGGRRFVVEFGPTPGNIASENALPRVSALGGEIVRMLVQPNAATGGARLSFELNPGSADTVELKANLMSGGRPVSETWIYRWLA